MSRLSALLFLPFLISVSLGASSDRAASRAASRVVILKIDGLNADLLYRTMHETDPQTGKSRLPWFSHIFGDNGTVFENFYARGISLSAPSWSMLDTGRPTAIRGNVEYDRYTGRVYDYLNFFPFYIGYARNHQVDMPGVEVLDRAGIPLLIDAFPYEQGFQSLQLFQRGVRWTFLAHVLARRFSSKALISTIENAGAPSLVEMLAQQTEQELKSRLIQPEVFYFDFYIGDIDHEGHATKDPAALVNVLRRLDAAAGRIWMAIQASSLANQTIFVAVSDHGMNNVPDVFSQAFSLPDLFNSPGGGAHHVVTNRHQLSDYKLLGLNPLVQRVTTPSTASFYLAGESDRYPTAWLDLDGNERAAVHLRHTDLNKIHILLLQLARVDLPPNLRKAAASCLKETIDCYRAEWTSMATEFDGELSALELVIEQRKKIVKHQPRRWTTEQKERGEDKQARRFAEQLQAFEREHAEYTAYLARLRALLVLQPDGERPFRGNISAFVPELTLGGNNGVRDLQHYIAGPSAAGLIVGPDGKLDEAHSFRYVNYFSLLAGQRVRNNPQAELASRPIDFTVMRLPDDAYAPDAGRTQHAYWLYGDDASQLLILQDEAGRIALRPVEHLTADPRGKIESTPLLWRSGLPLHLFEDPDLHVPAGNDAAAWLSAWHTEREWMQAVHMCRYSNGLIGVTEELSPVAVHVPGPAGLSPALLRYERRRRELVQPDFHVFAADHWNFNVRNFNPGGNHGAFFRISTHSVWMLAGSGIPTQTIAEPYDSLNFASTVLNLLGRSPPMPDRVVRIR